MNNATRNDAFVGVWDVASATANHATAVGAVLFGTTKGYIHPYYVRTITGWHRDAQTGRIWWDTSPADPAVTAFVGSGLWMPVKPARESDWA